MDSLFQLLLDISFVVAVECFLKVRVVYFKTDSTISGAFQCSAGAPLTYTSSSTNFLGVEGPFSNEMCPSRVVWGNCCLLGCVGTFLQLLKCFSKLLARLMVLLKWKHFSFLMSSSHWCCSSAALFEKNLVHLLHLCLVLSIKHSICRISSSVSVNMASSWPSVKFVLQPIVVDLI